MPPSLFGDSPCSYFDSILMELKRRRGLRQKLPVWGCFEHIAVEVGCLKSRPSPAPTSVADCERYAY
jgi:hypothetical protein